MTALNLELVSPFSFNQVYFFIPPSEEASSGRAGPV